MNIIGTINPWGCKNFNNTIRGVINKGINCFRVNLKTYYLKEHFDYLVEVIEQIQMIDNAVSFIFDIGYPRDTTRTIIMNDKGYIKPIENKIYISNNVPFYSENIVFINTNLNVESGDIIYYGDGQLYFTVTRCCGKGLWEICVNTAETVIWGNTALHFRSEVCDKPQNLDLVIDFLSKIQFKLDYRVALSFVEGKADIESFFKLCGAQNIISKIESQKAIDNIEEIMDCCDYIMLGRGDLLFNTKIENFFDNEIAVIRKCNERRKKIIVSTGILVSMQDEILPSRAELIDFLLLIKLEVDSINLSSHIIQSENIDNVINLINKLEKQCY